MAAKPLKILQWNACSVLGKRYELEDLLRRESVDIIIITESHLKPDKNIHLVGYSLVRLDRTTARGGGVAIGVKSNISFYTLPHPRTSVIEAVGVEVHTVAGPINIYAAYCHKICTWVSGRARLFLNDLALLTRPRRKFIIAGDFNAKHAAWNNSRSNINGNLMFSDSQLGYYTILAPDEQTFTSPSGSASTLDIFLSNLENQAAQPLTLHELSSDHLPVVLEVDHQARNRRNFARKDYHNVNWTAFQRLVDQNIDTQAALVTPENIDRAIGNLQRAIEIADEECVRKIPVVGKFSVLDATTKYVIRLRNIVRRQW